MNLPHYTYFAKNSYRDYEFYSNGPNGRIKKVVMFNKLSDAPLVYNLAFGDEDPVTGLVSDLVVSDNKDTNLVLATVANTVVDFCDRYGNEYIFVVGSTAARTRLYQIGISNILSEISTDFKILGSKNGVLYDFEKNVNYDSFLVKRK